ncbi:hypothetical protein FBR02_12995 [Anaerolineae bacterium CFX9]|nr:hypothetical protein [Anaerolineae bacterium CFX9]
MMSTDQAREAQAHYQEDLLAKNNVVGVGVGYKESEGVNTGEVAVVVLVEEKKPVAALREEDLIPRELNGLRTDVVEVGFLRAQQSPRSRFRPIIPSGVSMGHFKVTAGTLGTVVKDRVSGELFLLSNNHVFANSNDALIGDNILQPAAMDGGMNPGDNVATLERYLRLLFTDDPPGVQELVGPVPVKPTEPIPVDPTPIPNGEPTPVPDPNPPVTPIPQPIDSGPPGCLPLLVTMINSAARLIGSQQRVTATTAQALAAQTAAAQAMMPTPVAARAQNVQPENRVDAALARPINPGIFSDDIRTIGIVNEAKEPTLGMRVRKYGRTTEYTEGNIILLNATVNISYSTMRGTRTARFVNQVIAQGMSQGGDSGSLVVDASENRAVGLLFAGSAQATIFTPIQIVLDALGVDL